jgi:hypothetical protein
MGEPRSARSEVFGALTAGVVVTLFCFVLLWHDPLLFWNDDYEVSILPVFADVARSWSEGHWPLLSPYSWVCSNLAGEFQYGTFSIFINAAVVLIWKFALTFPQQAAALSMTHLFVLAMGAYLLARERKLSAPLSMMVALIATLNGWIMSWGATNWFGALGAWTWLPWTWWGLERAVDPRRGPWRFLWPAPFVYLLVTGGFPYTVGMLGLLTAWLALKSLVETKNFWSTLPLLFGSLLGLGLSAPAWLALIDYVHGSARQADPASSHFQWLVPPSALPAFILPNWTVNWTNFSTRSAPHASAELACGFVAPVALLVGLFGQRFALVRRVKWDLALFVLVLIISMLPSANLFRWSFRWLPLVHLLLALCAAEALQLLQASRRRFFSRPGPWAIAIIPLTIVAMLLARTGGRYAWPFVLILFCLALFWVIIDSLPANFRRLQEWMPAVTTFAALLVTYLWLPTNCGVPKFNLSQELSSPAPLDSQRVYLSIYPPPESAYGYPTDRHPVGQIVRPGSSAMWARLHFINGYSPVRAAGVARAFNFYVHGDVDPGTAALLLESQAGPDGELAKLGVDGIIVANEIQLGPKPEGEWELAQSGTEGRIYHRHGGTFERVRSVPALDSRPNEQFVAAAVKLIENSRNRVVADVNVPSGGRPALLTFSRPFFRGYQARIGPTSLDVSSDRGLYPTVELPPGTIGRVTLVYRPYWLIWGGGFSIVCAIFFLVVCGFAFRRQVGAIDPNRPRAVR